jgi:ABC-type multidrug transport system fused ATPase/permease subunit
MGAPARRGRFGSRTVRLAGHIVVLEEGRVIGQGSHDELMRTAGRYAELYERQASRYR